MISTTAACESFGFICAYAGILEYLQHFSLGRHPMIGDFAASGSGALCGGIAVGFVTPRWGRTSRQPPNLTAAIELY
jgi:hypothetical protein